MDLFVEGHSDRIYDVIAGWWGREGEEGMTGSPGMGDECVFIAQPRKFVPGVGLRTLRGLFTSRVVGPKGPRSLFGHYYKVFVDLCGRHRSIHRRLYRVPTKKAIRRGFFGIEGASM